MSVRPWALDQAPQLLLLLPTPVPLLLARHLLGLNDVLPDQLLA